MKKIYQILQMTPEDYEEFVLTFWMRWTESVTVDHREFLRVFSNAPVNEWFVTELKKCEEEFRLLASRYERNPDNLIEIRMCFDDVTYKMYSIFPKALLESAKKITDKTVAGIPINKLTIAQN